MSTFSDWLFETAKAQAEVYRLSVNPEPIDLHESMETDTLLGGDVENTKVREAASPTQFPTVAEQEHYQWCCANCDEIDARQVESMEQKL